MEAFHLGRPVGVYTLDEITHNLRLRFAHIQHGVEHLVLSNAPRQGLCIGEQVKERVERQGLTATSLHELLDPHVTFYLPELLYLSIFILLDVTGKITFRRKALKRGIERFRTPKRYRFLSSHNASPYTLV